MRAWIRLSFAAILLSGLAACRPQAQPVTTPLLSALSQELQNAPTNSELLARRGFAYAMVGEDRLARADFEAAVRLAPQDSETRRSYGWALYNLGDYRGALRQWDRELELSESPPWWTHHAHALAYWNLGDRTKALASYQAAATQNPERFATWEALDDYTSFWTWKEKQDIYTIFDAWDRAYGDKPPQPEPEAPAEMEAEETEEVAHPLLNQPFPAIQFTSFQGEAIDTAALTGRVVLVDFWATWCPPCRASIPHLLGLYNELHDAGFSIVGISLDKSEETLRAFMSQTGMTWPQQFDGRGWDNAVADQFGINAIPTTFLIDREGVCRGVDLYGDELREKIVELLGPAAASPPPSE